MLYKSMLEMIGHTPLLEANRYLEKIHGEAMIYTKLELFNPAGSVKDRVALMMIEEALKEGLLNEKSIIVEPTSGNTGIGLAAVCKAKGLKAVIVMPETMSDERKQLLKAYGAQLVLTDGSKGMQGAIDEAERMVSENKDAIMAGQFINPSNPLAHYLTTAKEIDEDLSGQIDYFIAGIGTGGTISGIGRYLKEKNPNIKIIGIEPEDSPLLTQHYANAHGIQGIGANFIPKVLDQTLIDQIETVSTTAAYEACRQFMDSEGILVGISSGAALAVAKKYSQNKENKGKHIVVLLPDGGERYLSTGLFEE